IRSVTFTPSSLDKYATNGVQRSVTPEAFSAGTTAKVNSGYLVFHSCADAADAVRASAAAPARNIRRSIMTFPVLLQRNQPIAGLQPATFYVRGTQAAAAVPRAGILELVGSCRAGTPITSSASRSYSSRAICSVRVAGAPSNTIRPDAMPIRRSQ